jgi:hypothetical protein
MRKEKSTLSLTVISVNETRENQFIDRVRNGISVPLGYNLAGCIALTFGRSRVVNDVRLVR